MSMRAYILNYPTQEVFHVVPILHILVQLQISSVIKFAIVKELQQFLVFFHFVPDVQPHGNYSEMFMYNALQKEGSLFF